MLSIKKISDSISEISNEYDIKKAALFGSYADNTCTEESDVDLLVEFFAPYVSLFKISGLKYRLEEMLEKSVDIIHSPLPPDSMIDVNKEIVVYEA